MNWNTQQPNLPYNPDAPQQGKLNISLNNPPYVPQRYDGPGEIANIMPLVAAACAMEIQNRADKNPLRMFMFNQYGRNNFANEDFDALVKATCDFIAFEMMNRRYPNMEAAAENCVAQMCEMLCTINLRLFPDLERWVPQDKTNTLRQTIANFDNLCGQINRMKQGGNVSSGPNWGGGGGGWGGGQMTTRWGGGGGQGGGGGGWSSQWGGGQDRRGGGSTSLFSSGDRAPVSSNTGNVVSKYSSDEPLKQPFTPRARQEKPVEQAQQAPQVEEAAAISGKIKWKPSQRYPYCPAIDPALGEIWLRKKPDGSVEPFVKQKEEGTTVDYNAHATGAIFGPPPRALDMTNAAQAMANIEQGVRKINKAAQAAEEDQAQPEVTTFIKQQTIIETSLEAAWFSGALERLTAPDGKIPDVYRVYARIADPIVGMHNENDAIRNLGNAKTYIELKLKLETLVNELTPALWGAVNFKMTAAINRVLQQNMGLPETTIDSFYADLEDLIAYLGKHPDLGNTPLNVFQQHQKEVIASALQTLPNEFSGDLSDNYMADRKFAENVKPEITYLSSDYSLTYLNCLSHELRIDLIKGVGSVVTKAGTPLLHDLLEGLFADIEQRGNNFERHLIMTNDGRELETTKGYFNEDSFLLTLIK